MDPLHALLDKLPLAQKRRTAIRAIMGDGQGNLFPTDPDGNRLRGYVWVRIQTGSDGGLTVRQIRNRRVTPVYGLPVMLGYGYDKNLEVQAEDPTEAIDYNAGRGTNVDEHAWAHSVYGPDSLWVQAFQFMPLLVHPAFPADLTIQIEHYSFSVGGTPHYYPGETLDLTSYLPANAGEQRIVVIALDPSTLLAGVTAAASFTPLSTVGFSMPFTAADVAAVSTTTGLIRLAGIRLYYGQTRIAWTDWIEDLRESAGNGAASGGTVTSVALTMPSIFGVTGSPITGAGTLAVSLVSQSANKIFASPHGGAGVPTFRSLVAADIPQLAHSSLSGLTTGDDHTQYLLRQPSADWTIDANALRMGAIGGAAVAAQKLTVYTGADANKGLIIKANSATQSANLQEWQNNSGAILGSISAGGYHTLPGIIANQSAESAVIQFASINPVTVGFEPYQIQTQSFANAGAGTGTYNHGTFFGWNASVHAGKTGYISGKPAILMGFEDNYYDNGVTNLFGAEWYVEYWSPDGISVQAFRPFYTRIVNENNANHGAIITHDIGTDGTGEWALKTGATIITSVVPGQYTSSLLHTLTNTTDATDSSHASLILRGGAWIDKSLFVVGELNATMADINGTVTYNTTTDRLKLGILTSLPSASAGSYVGWANGISGTTAGDLLLIGRSDTSSSVITYAGQGSGNPVKVMAVSNAAVAITGTLTTTATPAANGKAINGVSNPTVTSGTTYGTMGQNHANPASSSTATHIGLRGIADTNTASNVGALYGSSALAQHSQAGTVASAYGSYGQAQNTGAGTITNGYAIYGNISKSAGAITNAYGLYIDSVTAGGTLNYAIFTNGGLVNFGDSVGIGISAPTAYLHVKASTTTAASLRLAAGTAPTSPNAGDVWHDSTQKSLIGFLAGIKQSLLGVLFTQTADKTVANTVTETTLFTTGIGSITLPTDFFVVGKDIRIRAKGYFSTSGNPNIQFKIKYGSTVLLDSGAFSAGTDVSNHLWFIDAVITCWTTGSSGTVFAQGFGKLYSAHTTVTEFDMETTATTTINTTTSNALDLTVTWGTADAGDTITATNISVETLN